MPETHSAQRPAVMAPYGIYRFSNIIKPCRGIVAREQMRLALTPNESDLLLASTETSALTSALLVVGQGPVLEGTAEQFDELREAVSDALLRIGFDEDYKPMSDGVVLEGLIDKLLV